MAAAGAGGNATPSDLCAVVLAAGAGTRLRPLTSLVPKALCPVGASPLVDLALTRAASVAGAVAVNAHHGRDLLVDHLRREHPDVHLSVEREQALGTAGALGALRGWVDGRGCLVVNADAWAPGHLDALVADWDGERVRLLTVGGAPLGPRVQVAGCLLPWPEVRALEAVPTGLYERVWRRAAAEGHLDVVAHRGPFVDCGTVADYLRANQLAVTRGEVADVAAHVARGARVERSVLGEGAVVEGTVRDSVVWPGARVAAGEVLVGAVRATDGLTIWPGAGWGRG